MTLISRLLGFVRDIVFAYIFGAHGGFDAFVVAFKIPNFMRRLFAEGAFAQAFVPVLSEYRTSQTPEEAQIFMNRIVGNLAATLLIVTLIAEIAAPLLIILFAPGFLTDPNRYQMALHLLRITFPYMMLISLTAFCSAVLNSYSIFAVPAFTPVLLNVTLISVALWVTPYFHVPVVAIAWGVLLGGVVQLCFQLPFMARNNLLPKPSLVWNDPGVKKVLKLMVPAIFGVSVAQISLLIDTLFASFLPPGSISWLYYSQQLTFFPLGVFGVALATVVLPSLSRAHIDKSLAQYNATVDWAIRCVLVIAIPAMLGLLLLAGPLIATLFQSSGSQFDIQDVYFTKKSLIAFSVGLPGFMMTKVIAAAFYARQDIKGPVRIAVIALIANIALNALFIVPLAHAGLALATSISSSGNALLLYLKLRRDKIYTPLPGWSSYMMRLAIASLAMMLVISWFAPPLNDWFELGRITRMINLLAWVGLAVITYVSCLTVSGMRLSHFKVQSAGEV